MRYGLIGEKLGHSYSKIIHEKLADYHYELIPLSREEFKLFMEAKEFSGINVTIPYKQEVIPYLNELDPLAEKIGAVNTVVNREGYLTGYNTDFYGMIYMFEHNGIAVKDKKCLVLGNGGTSKTAQAVLTRLGAGIILVVSRKPEENMISYRKCYESHIDAEIIVNTTPVGMYPKVNASPLDLSVFHGCEAVVDVIFNPLKTRLAEQAEELHIKAVTGLEMLVAQAKQAAEYFTVQPINDSRIDEIYHFLLEML